METSQLLIIIGLFALLAEVTYLVVKLPRQNMSKKQGRLIFVDTSVLIDGRIISVAESGFIGDTLVIPRSVIGELQFLADNADHDKRARARHGLDVVKELQQMTNVSVELMQDGSKAEEGVDERLLKLAKQHSGAICTIDYNLNKVAAVEGIVVLNVNELAKTLRMAYLPGERMLLELIQKGQDGHQAVGHLTDGTMVVVEHASKNIGQTVEIEFIRSLQTAAGKMMFAKLVEPNVLATPTVKKPLGKRPRANNAAVAAHKPPVEAKPLVHHAKPHVENRAPREQRQRQEHSGPKPAQQKKQQPQRSNRPRTSADREAALIDLVDNM